MTSQSAIADDIRRKRIATGKTSRKVAVGNVIGRTYT